MSTLSPREQEMFKVGLGELPEWYHADDTNPQSVMAGFAKLFGKVWDQIDNWVDQIYLKQAAGMFLDAHARDRGTRRQTGEGDGALASRLVVPPDALTIPALTQIANAILAGAGIAGSASIEEGRNGAGAYWQADGNAFQSFWGWGQRFDGHPHDIYVILPIGTDAGTMAAVEEAMRQFAAGGVEVTVEKTATGESYQMVTITPPAAHATHGGGTVPFTAQKRVTDTVTWQVNGIVGGNSTVGTIVGGVYTPPAAVPRPEDVEVQAVSVLDNTKIGRAKVKIV